MPKSGESAASRALNTSLNRVGASQQIAQALLRFISRLPPGTRIGSEASLAEEFEVSRPTVREALQMLSSAHRVQIIQGRNGGVFVASSASDGLALNINDSVSTMLETDEVTVEELLEARHTIEPRLASLAAERANDEEIATMLATIEASLGFGHLDPFFLQCDRDLHLAIARASQNSLLTATTSWFREVLQPRLVATTAQQVTSDDIVAQHRAIVAAIAARDPERAHHAMSDHIMYFHGMLAEQSESKAVPHHD